MLKPSPGLRFFARQRDRQKNPPTLRDQLSFMIVYNRFSGKRWSEEMLRGPKNEESGISFFRQIKVVNDVFNVDMLVCKDHPYLAASPDAISLLNYPNIDTDCSWGSIVLLTFELNVMLAVVNINTEVSDRSLVTVLEQAEADMCFMHIDSDDAETSIPIDHLAHMVLQIKVKAVSFAVDMCTEEAGVVSTSLLYCSYYILTPMPSFMATNSERLFGMHMTTGPCHHLRQTTPDNYLNIDCQSGKRSTRSVGTVSWHQSGFSDMFCRYTTLLLKAASIKRPSWEYLWTVHCLRKVGREGCYPNYEYTNDKWLHDMATDVVWIIPWVFQDLFVTSGLSEQDSKVKSLTDLTEYFGR